MLPNFGFNFWIKTLNSRALKYYGRIIVSLEAVRRPVLETERGGSKGCLLFLLLIT